MYDWLLCGLVTASIVSPPAPAPAPGQDDRVAGTLVIDGDPLALRHVLARKVPAFWDKEQIVTQVLLTAEPVPEEALKNGRSLLEAVRAGTVTGVRLEYDDDGRSVTGNMLSPRLAGDLRVSRSGSKVRPSVCTASRIEGRFEADIYDLNGTPVVVNVSWAARVRPMPVMVQDNAGVWWAETMTF